MVYAPDFSRMLVDGTYGLDTLTLKVQDEDDIVLTDCVLTEPVDTREMEATDGQVPQMDQMMVWPVSKSPVMPPLGSCLVDSDDIYWTILAIRRKQHVETWEARCRNLSIIASTSNEVTLLRAVYGKGRANEARAHWRGLYSGEWPTTEADTIPAKLQPATELAQIRYGAEWAKQTYRLILTQKLDIDLAGGEFRVLDASGNHYRIIELIDEARLDRFPVAIVVRIIEGREFFREGSPSPLTSPTFPSP